MIGSIDATGLRLALFTDTALPQLNGVTRTLHRLVRTVQARGGEVLTLTTTDRDVIEDPAVRRYSSIPFWAYPQLRLAAPGRSAVMRELRDFEPTLVHAATPFGVGLAGRAAARRLGVPFVSSYHTSFSAYAEFYGLGSLAAPGWPYLRWFHNRGLRTYCPTRAVQDELEMHGLRNTRLWGRGVDTARFSPRHRHLRQRAPRGDGIGRAGGGRRCGAHARAASRRRQRRAGGHERPDADGARNSALGGRRPAS